MDVSLFRQLRQAAKLLAAEVRASSTDGVDDPRQLLLRSKTIFEVGYREGPVPDGLSEAYIKLSATRTAEAGRADVGGHQTSSLTRILAAAVNKEIATARVLEMRLLELVEAPPPCV